MPYMNLEICIVFIKFQENYRINLITINLLRYYEYSINIFYVWRFRTHLKLPLVTAVSRFMYNLFNVFL